MHRSSHAHAPQGAETGGPAGPLPAAKPPNSFNPAPLGSAAGANAPVPTVKPPNAFSPPKGDGAAAATAGGEGGQPAASKIRAFEQRLGGGQHAESWKRPTNLTGTGATHVKSFHCKLSSDAIEFLDRQINEWLDAHPDYEVKQVTSSVGEWQGKIKEPALIVQVWV